MHKRTPPIRYRRCCANVSDMTRLGQPPLSWVAKKGSKPVEAAMQERVVSFMHGRGHSLCMREYEVFAGHPQYGRGDLWFRLSSGVNFVVETKVRRPAKARVQTIRYAAWVALKTNNSVAYTTYVASVPKSMADQLLSVETMTPGRAKGVIEQFLHRAMLE